jgi:TolB-like protein/cytochrome c-type biogenesis protein CcmH/NrfG
LSGISHAVFLSYASQDAEAAQKICDALRAAGIEVWFDQSALRGGDVWDQAIRKQIKTCALFIPVISRHTHDRDEGYFRLEWKLAVDRSHQMTSNRAFLLPVVIDETREDDENVPDRFKDIHWTRLPAGELPAAFVERVRGLVSPEPSRGSTEPPLPAGPPPSAASPPLRERASGSSRSKRALPALVGVVVAGTLAYLAIDRLRVVKPQVSPSTPPAASANVAPTTFSPPPHSIAVLPFVNMSGDKEQEYFSDGLTEELLNSLSRINELQVAARTSSFSFKGKDTDIGNIARKLNVGAVLEGSVRRSAHTVRITAQLINAVTGFHLWSETYDRDLGDMLKLQTEIANAVAAALRVTLLADTAVKIELGGTRVPTAFDAYLRGSKAYVTSHSAQEVQAAIAAYTEAIGLDLDYALAIAARSLAFGGYATSFATGQDRKSFFDKALADAQHAIALTPDLAESHLALGNYFENGSLDFARATQEYERAATLAPGNAEVLRRQARFVVSMGGRADAAVAAGRRVVVLDPLNARSHFSLGEVLFFARQYKDAIAAFHDSVALDPDDPAFWGFIGQAYYVLGDPQRARASCENKSDWTDQVCLAMAYNQLGRHSDAQAMLAKLTAGFGDDAAYQYAEIYAQWGSADKALTWLETALRLRDPGLADMNSDPFLDPLRKEPRFQAIVRALKFPLQ